MKRGRGKAVAVGEIIHVAEDKCIFSTRLIPCTHFQPPCTSTSFYIPRSIRIILPPHPLLFVLLFLAISAATWAPWLRQNDRGLFHTVWNTPGATFIFPVRVATMAGTQPLGQARRYASTHVRLFSNLIGGGAAVFFFSLFYFLGGKSMNVYKN